MKRVPSILNRILGPSPLVRVLFAATLLLAAAVLAVGLAAPALGLGGKGEEGREPSWQRGRTVAKDGYSNFEGLGDLRVRSADREPALLGLSIVLVIPDGDKAFEEELVSKTPELKAECLRILGARKAAELSPAFEGALKARIRDGLNGLLLLGKIEEVSFPAYQLFE